VLNSRSFLDFRPGDRVTTLSRTVTEADIAAFADLTGDFYPLHVDDEYARESRFGRRIAHGPLVYSLAIGLMPIEFFGDGVVAFLGVDGLRHLAPVFVGDTMHVVSEVTAAVPSKSSSSGGVVTVRYSVVTDPDLHVMTADLHFLMRAGVRPTSLPAPEDVDSSTALPMSPTQSRSS